MLAVFCGFQFYPVLVSQALIIRASLLSPWIFFFLSSVTFSGDLPAIHIDVATLHPEVTPSPWKRLSLAVAPVPVH